MSRQHFRDHHSQTDVLSNPLFQGASLPGSNSFLAWLSLKNPRGNMRRPTVTTNYQHVQPYRPAHGNPSVATVIHSNKIESTIPHGKPIGFMGATIDLAEKVASAVDHHAEIMHAINRRNRL